MIAGISVALKPVMILFCVGLLIGSWILSGTVPTMIYYSLLILDPAIFYAASCVICALISLSIGSSWTVAGTVGIALIGAAGGLGVSLEVTAGAIISGAYFGDKLSPLSETTNLAPAVAGTDLFSHIGHMLWTTIPSIVIALVLFTLMGLNIRFGSRQYRSRAHHAPDQRQFHHSSNHAAACFDFTGHGKQEIPARPDHSDRRFTGGVTRTHFSETCRCWGLLARRKMSFWLISVESGKPCSMVSRSAAVTQLWMTS